MASIEYECIGCHCYCHFPNPGNACPHCGLTNGLIRHDLEHYSEEVPMPSNDPEKIGDELL